MLVKEAPDQSQLPDAEGLMNLPPGDGMPFIATREIYTATGVSAVSQDILYPKPLLNRLQDHHRYCGYKIHIKLPFLI